MAHPKHIVVAAGGTGGHMVPAHVLAQALIARGHHVSLITDERGLGYPGLFENCPRHTIPSASIAGRNPIAWLRGLHQIREGRAAALRLYDNIHPSVVVGFGGYPALPALLAALKVHIPTVIHEQNAVLGRVNRLLAGKVHVIATAYPDIKRLKPRHADKVALVGNPVREEIVTLRHEPFPDLMADGIFRLLVIGGSQGATILSNVVPTALEMLPLNLRRRLQVTQQCRPEDIDVVRAAYAKNGIAADLASFLPDMPERLAWAHLVIARSGASTLAELTTAGRPAILVPLPSATDDHQTWNTREMVEAGGARMIRQSNFTPTELAKQIQKMALEPGALANAAKRARSVGRPDAGLRLATIVERLAGVPLPIDGEHSIGNVVQGALA